MKILFISDIHGITTNLDKIKNIYDSKNFDKLVVLGDLYYGGFNTFNLDESNNKIVRNFFAEYSDKIICMRGNCDSDIDVSSSEFPICSDVSLINVDGIDIYLSHGDRYNVDMRDKFRRKGVLVYGHYHIPYIKKIDDMVFVCVGSVSLPRNGSGFSYGVYEDRKIILYTIDGDIIESVNL
jgi:hypothetical protein